MAQDHYATLGLSKGASEDEVRKAYRDLARKYHPDLNPEDDAAKKKFHEVQAAFEVLNDPKKRELYDRYGANYEAMSGAGGARGGWPGGAPGGGGAGEYEFDINDIFGGGGGGATGGGGFADLFRQFRTPGAGGAGGAGRERHGRAAAQRGADVSHEITVPFATAVLGGTAALQLSRATGKQETISVQVPAGITSGKKIRLRGQGNPSPNGGADGDILLTVRVAGHPLFERTGNRLDLRVPITLAEAAAGGKIDVPTPHGAVTLSVPPGSSSGKRLRVRGHGVRPKSGEPGDLYVELQVVLPEGLTDEDRSQLVEIAGRHPENPRSTLKW
ncbi:Chaperone protein DnaJ [Pirellulimonas nuda]|uniref:Chaperone protein DnaJ n=1 Tax=Pirellulimonas nuda TaxID=2528009 RepID=A0A518DH22_9BACT|nr:J domain-containing protein [Pirellulimonas nuda]QDU90777.1 Chaperone protein DnaJ [Pirellulimonas nuda]